MKIDPTWVNITDETKTFSQTSLAEFDELVSRGQPAIIKDAIKDTPACTSWTVEYLRESAGECMVEVYVTLNHQVIGGMDAYDGVSKELVTMRFDEFLDRLLGEDARFEPILGTGEKYLLYQNSLSMLKPLEADLSVPSYIAENRYGRIENGLWVGSQGNMTMPHTDGWSDGLLLQVTGVKEFLLWSPDQIDLLYTVPFGKRWSRQCMVDLFKPDPDTFPKFRDAHAIYGIIETGDMLLIPEGWLHYVYTRSFCISVTYGFKYCDELEKAITDAKKQIYALRPELKTHFLHLLGWPEDMIREMYE